MFKKLKKSVIAFLVAVPTVCALGAVTSVALDCFDSGGIIVAEAASGTVVTEVGDVVKTFDGTAYYGPDIAKYWVTRITNRDGEELNISDGVTNVGEYYFYYTPQTGCTWTDGSTDEKSYKVTITQATLLWKFIDKRETIDVADAYKEVDYTQSRTNYISKIYAECGNLSYNKSSSSSTKAVTIVKNGDTAVKKNVIDSGTYTFTVAEEDKANYKNPTFTFKILPMEVNIGESVNLNWTIDGSTDATLAGGNVYCYNFNRRGSDKVESVYTTLKLNKAPFNNWENWTEYKNGQAYAINGISAYKEDKATKIKLYRDSGSLKLYNAVYSGECSATESGKYVAKAVITPVDNYTLIYTPSDISKNMTITSLEDGAYEITKTWYVAYYVNEFISQSSFDTETNTGTKTDYAFPQKWTFGELNEEITAPCLAHGDEVRMKQLIPSCYSQPDGYTLENATDREKILEIIGDEVTYMEGMEEWERGEKDLVTFSITWDDGTTVCLDEPRSKLSYYVNQYMPVGKYTITFKAKNVGIGVKHNDWWNGNKGSNCGNEYFGITSSYSFEVTEQKLKYTDNLNFFSKQDKSPLELNLYSLSNNLEPFFALAYDRIEGDVITKDDVLQSQTYWSTVVDSFYGDKLELRFKLKDSGDDNYYSKDNVTVWNDKISKLVPKSYYLYYTVSIPNYVSVPQSDFENYYFEVTVFEELELPYLLLDTLQYTGQPRTVQVGQTDHRYTIAGNTRTQKGDYKVTFTISNPTLNHWKGVEGAIYEIDWHIVDKPLNGWVEGGELHLDDWFWSAYNGENNVITATPLSGEPVFSISTDAEGLNLLEGLQAFKTDKAGHVPYVEGTYLAALSVGEYYLWAKISETEIHAPYVSTGYKFSVKAAQNGWVSEPSISNWKVGETPDLSAINGASPIYGTAVYKIVSEFDEDIVYYDSSRSLNIISRMPVGRYYLVATVAADAACYSGIEFKRSVVVSDDNSDEAWLIKPEISNWANGETPSQPNAMSVAEGSTVEFSYLTKGGKRLDSQPTAIGEYILVAVAYSRDGAELARAQVEFKITGISGGIIALIVILSVLFAAGVGVLVFFLIKRKRKKGGASGGDGGGDDNGNLPNEGEEIDGFEGEENADTPPNMPQLTDNLGQIPLDQNLLQQDEALPLQPYGQAENDVEEQLEQTSPEAVEEQSTQLPALLTEQIEQALPEATEETPVEEPPVEEAPTEELPVEETPTEEISTENRSQGDEPSSSQPVSTPKSTAKKVRSTAQKVRSKNSKPRSSNAKVRAKKPEVGNVVGNEVGNVVGDAPQVDNQAPEENGGDNQS